MYRSYWLTNSHRLPALLFPLANGKPAIEGVLSGRFLESFKEMRVRLIPKTVRFSAPSPRVGGQLVAPSLVGQRSRIQLVPKQSPIRQELVHQASKAIIMVPLK
jgi:hypothetical protein